MPNDDRLLHRTRRHFFHDCGAGIGKAALASLIGSAAASAAPRNPHYAPKATNVIFLFMAGAPSQFELFEFKPKLLQYDGQVCPKEFMEGKRFAFMETFAEEPPKLLGSSRKFNRCGESGVYVSELLPHFSKVVDEVAFVRTVHTDNFNHAPAKIFLNTGSIRFGRPSMGSWVTYGIGSESDDLPGFVVLQSGPRGPRGGALNWGSGFLPTSYQGVPFRSGGDPILNLSTPGNLSATRQRQVIDAVNDLNKTRLADTGDPEISTRIASYEMAYRMQTAGPELIDFAMESPATLELYGAKPGEASFANNCLLARRLVERGVRFVQLYHTDWDHHGGPVTNLQEGLEECCQQVDRPMMALIQDLKQRGLLDSTLIVWGGEFGRTPMGERRETIGRNHHIDAYTMWFAGAGIKAGASIGETDEFGFFPVAQKVHIHDIQATILHLLGLDHTKLTFRFQGRDFRLTDVAGELIPDLLA